MTERRFGLPVVGIAAGLFCLMLIYLALQVRAGSDPAIGAEKPAETAEVPRDVLVRRVIITRVIEEPPVAAPSTQAAPVTAAVSAAAPAAVSAPAPAAPAPAPAPAPVVSSGS